jgi:hypothetical protein
MIGLLVSRTTEREGECPMRYLRFIYRWETPLETLAFIASENLEMPI